MSNENTKMEAKVQEESIEATPSKSPQNPPQKPPKFDPALLAMIQETVAAAVGQAVGAIVEQLRPAAAPVFAPAVPPVTQQRSHYKPKLQGIPVEPGQDMRHVPTDVINNWFNTLEQRWRDIYNKKSHLGKPADMNWTRG